MGQNPMNPLDETDYKGHLKALQTLLTTPGPWVADGNKVEGAKPGYMHDIAYCVPTPPHVHGNYAPGNAKLIARAPMMQEALEAIVEAVGGWYNADYVFEEDWNEDAHLEDGQNTLTIGDLRKVYLALGYKPND